MLLVLTETHNLNWYDTVCLGNQPERRMDSKGLSSSGNDFSEAGGVCIVNF